MSNELVLLVDDEQNIIDLNKMYLEQAGYRTVTAMDGLTALDVVASHNPDLIVLDLMLPELDGWEVCKRIRAESDVPIIMLTANNEDIDKIVGLELGADDYMTKPFNPRELIARMKAIFRRMDPKRDLPNDIAPLELSNIMIDPARRVVTVDGEPIDLRTKEFDLLFTLIENKGIVLSREKLLEIVWGFDFAGETRTVDVHIAHLRHKLEASHANIETVWGVGYKIV